MLLTLPKPPTINHLYKITCRGGFPHYYVSDEGSAWFEECGYILKRATKKRDYEGDISLYFHLYTARTSDLDNVIKATQDLLQKTGVIKNDRQVIFLQGQKTKVKVDEQKIEIEIPEL
jgi:Holliday junction resolvase RusA-like endonuclease